MTPDGESDAMRHLPFSLMPWPEYPSTGFGWPVAPDYLRIALLELQARYGDALPPIVITEGGASFPDVVADDGTVDDPARVRYLAAHLDAAITAVPGIDVRGYYVWSLLDNWEWAAGYTQRFGLVHVDFDTQTRTPKTSYRWLQSVIGGRS